MNRSCAFLTLAVLCSAAAGQNVPAASKDEDSRMVGRILACAEDRGGGYLKEARDKCESMYADLHKKDYGPRDTWIGVNQYGRYLLAAGNFAKALDVFDEAKSTARKDAPLDVAQREEAESTFHRAFALDRLGRLDEAIKEYEAARILSPNNSGILLELGSAYRRASRSADAHAAYEQALQLDPKNPSGYGNLGNLLLTEGKTEDAVAQFEKAAQLSTDKGWAAKNFLNAAWQYQQKKDFDKALAACQRASAIAPDYPLAHADTGYAFAGLGRKDEARAEFQKALSLHPDDRTKQYIQQGMKALD